MWVHVTLNDIWMPRHLGLIVFQPFDLTVSKSPRIHDLHYFEVSDFATPHITNPPKSQVSGFLDLVPRVFYLSTIEIHFVIRDFGSFHTLKTLGQVPLEYKVSRLWDFLPHNHSSNGSISTDKI